MSGKGTGLWLVGLGPGDLGNMSLDAVEAAKGCDYRFLEGYTALLPENQFERLEKLVGGFSKVMRPEVEEPDEILTLAKDAKVALMVMGDPLQATTHVDLQLRAADFGVECHVVHGISVTTIVPGVVGLQSYRFGRQVTLAYPYGEYLATSPFQLIQNNREGGLHTLVLLDLDPTGMGIEEQRPMSPKDAISIIKKSSNKEGVDISDWMGVLCSDLGTSLQMVMFGTLDEIAASDGGRINCLIIPGRLDDMESRALERWRF